eukprot:TRINITY_DN12164_c0_g1_i1.p1 TRINITY_DN12164_c0_g1~~TRINITY_DN12164_c0_g1_i1.p1  ORF type:complete len:337 (-),score=58.13 TRINITY_DN12164_c0_g1_i1:10-1020(-)
MTTTTTTDGNSPTNIPMVDFSLVSECSGHDEQKSNELGEIIAEVLRTAGFMYVKNHGIPQSLIDGVMNTAQNAFHLPVEVKDQNIRSPEFKPSSGFVRLGVEKLDHSNRYEVRESFNYVPYEKENTLEKEVPEFEPALKALYGATWDFTQKFLRCLARGLHLENKEYFTDAHKLVGQNGNFTSIRIQNYPSINKAISLEESTRCGAHSDHGSVTVLFQDDVGGLRVETTKDNFVPVVPIPGTLIINIGDLMQRWTSDVLRSTVHAVTLGQPHQMGRERRSIAFFLHPDDEYVVRCIEDERLVSKEKSEKYPPINARQYLKDMMQHTYYTRVEKQQQ